MASAELGEVVWDQVGQHIKASQITESSTVSKTCLGFWKESNVRKRINKKMKEKLKEVRRKKDRTSKTGKNGKGKVKTKAKKRI